MSSKSPGQKRKQFIVKIIMLDDQEVPFQIESKTTGNDLINIVYQYLKLVESDYFGLEFFDIKGKKCWLDYDKAVSKQVSSNSKLIFCVKFYTPDPGQLEEEYTRYLYALQIKRDLSEGLLLCSDATASLLVSYILQAEIGDYIENCNNGNNSLSYFQNKRFFPHQNEEHEAKILDYYKNHIGQTPADADLNLLDIARKIELYGIIMHPAKDHEGVQLNLAVAHMGILVFQNYTKINTFSWAKIRKLSFRRKKFLVKLHPENYGFYKDTVEFYFENRDDSKNFWKKCIEHHSFFRCISTQRMPRQKSKLLTRGSSFRYYGRTQKELIENARENFSKNRSFDRSYHSMRSISQIGGSNTGANNGQINGTQSLNRNLASRSAGALMMPTNASSTLSSNDSGHHFHGFNQNNSSSAHHLSYNVSTQLTSKSATLLTNSTDKNRGIIDQQTDPNSTSSLNNYSIQQSQQGIINQPQSHYVQINNNQLQQQQLQHHLDDSSTHGSRTIDSRYSRDKTLGLSDGDEENDSNINNDEDDDDDDDDEEDEENKINHANDLNDANITKLESDQTELLQSDESKIKNDRCPCGKQHNNEILEKNQTQNLLENNLEDNSLSSQSLKPIQQQQKIPVGSKNLVKMNDINSDSYGLSNNNSFKISNLKPQFIQQQAKLSMVNNSNLVTLPIQQQQKISSRLKKNDLSSSVPTTDNESSSVILSTHSVNNYNNNNISNNSNNMLITNNPNKIYSRKEVITTYKEEIKNTHLEEYHQTTTFYDAPSTSLPPTSSGLLIQQQPSQLSNQQIYTQTTSTTIQQNPSTKTTAGSASSSSSFKSHVPVNNNNNNLNPSLSSSSSTSLTHPHYHELTKQTASSLTPTQQYSSSLAQQTTVVKHSSSPQPSSISLSSSSCHQPLTVKLTTTNKNFMNTNLNIIDQRLQQKNQLVTNSEEGDVDDSKLEIENDNDDEATKNERCSLAATILYSNFQRSNKPIASANKESLKRPSSLAKSLISSSPSNSCDPRTNFYHTRNSMNNNYRIENKSINNDNNQQNLTDSEDHFPPPPPIPQQQQPHQHYYHHRYPNQPPTILQDYQEPIKHLNNLSNNEKFLQSNLSSCQIYKSKSSNLISNVEDEFKKKKIPLEESYFIIKELVMTERTYKKDLDLITQTFRQFATSNNFDLSELHIFDQLIYSKALDPINEFHSKFLKDLETRLFYWTDKSISNNEDNQKIGDLISNINQILKNYRNYIEKYEDILNELELACKRNKKFDDLFKNFESQKICYLPFTMFLLKPIQRLIHYKLLFERLLIYYGVKHLDYQQTYSIFLNIEDINELINEKIPTIENKQKLMELQRDLIGVDNLVTHSFKFSRSFIREGSLQKLSRKGYQQRMFFLFNDMLLYCARSSTPILQFKVHGEYHLKQIQIEDGNSHINIPNSFTIYSSNRSLLVAAVSQEEKNKWLHDLYEAIEKVKNLNDEKHNYLSLKSNSSSDNNLDTTGLCDQEGQNDLSEQNCQTNSVLSSISINQKQQHQHQQHRANTTMHVCWHRNTSVSSFDNHRSIINQLSGYLLRKFKNSNGWQKLWVVFTNFCLFFYKNFQDEFPLASLPLLGYTVTIPNEADNITKEYVFKLQFKNHVYFFRAESQYSYDRWLEVIESAAQKQCLFNSNE